MRRIDDAIPAVIYGGGKDVLMIQIPHKDMAKALEDESFHSRLLTLEIGSEKEQVILKDLQKHPAKPRILHADFYRVSADHKLTLKVPLHYINEDKCIGIKLEGGMLIRNINEVEVSCLPGNIPEYIEVNVEELGLNGHIHLSDIIWPEGVESVELSHGESHNLSIVTVAEQRTAEEQEPEPEAMEDEEEIEGATEESTDEGAPKDAPSEGGEGKTA
jgi:large subunit ribosomal protein L25